VGNVDIQVARSAILASELLHSRADLTPSSQLLDWYAPDSSLLFSKNVIEFELSSGGVVVEATEFPPHPSHCPPSLFVLDSTSCQSQSSRRFGDVIMTAGLPVSQGIEAPYEDSDSCISHCGQATTLPFYVTYGHSPAPAPDPWPKGDPEGLEYHQQNLTWQRDWTYRRVSAGAAPHYSSASPGETSVINTEGGNDYANGYLLYPLDSPELKAQLRSGAWRGGINITAYAAAEQRAYGFYHWFKLNASSPITPFLSLNSTHTGTATGLSKMPYLRDTRRSSRVARRVSFFFAISCHFLNLGTRWFQVDVPQHQH
jgi:hypothetical protein